MKNRDGVISAIRGQEKIVLTYKNDTVYGKFFYYKNNNLIESGYLDNHRVRYLTEIEYNTPKFQQGESDFGTKVEYYRHKLVKDTFEMLFYDLRNSLLIGWNIFYYPNGTIKGKINYEIGTDEQGNNSVYRLKDTSVWYFETGAVKDFKIKDDGCEVINEFYLNGALKSKIYRIYRSRKLSYFTYDNYYSSGKLKNTASLSFIDGKKEGIEQEYNEKGNLISISYYKSGELNKHLCVDINGKLKEKR